jgi:hypothetical protein
MRTLAPSFTILPCASHKTGYVYYAYNIFDGVLMYIITSPSKRY